MSEPTYRVELTHHPEYGSMVRWRAAVSHAADPGHILIDFHDETMKDAFEIAQEWVRRKSEIPQPGRTVMLTEDGDIIDYHEAGVLRDANA